MKIFELFDNPITNITWHTEGSTDFAQFKVDDLQYEVDFQKLILPVYSLKECGIEVSDLDYKMTGYDVNFTMNNFTHPTGTGKSITVFSTVINIINDYVARQSPDFLYIFASDVIKSRINLYDRLIKTLVQNKYEVRIGRNHMGKYWFIIL